MASTTVTKEEFEGLVKRIALLETHLAKSQKPAKTKNTLERLPSVSDITYFFDSNTRAENDSSNRIREQALLVLNNPSHPFFTDTTYGAQWTQLRNEFTTYIKNHLKYTDFTRFVLEKKAGLGNHHDFNLTLYKNDIVLQIVTLEFKHNSVPQFMQEFDKNQWTTTTLAEFWYDNGWLDRIIALYPQPLAFPKPSREVYLKEAHKMMTSKFPPSFFKQFYDFDHSDTYSEQSKKKAQITQEGIAAFLAQHGNSFKVSKLKEKCQAEQTSKKYCIWRGGKFHFEEITDAELSPSAIDSVTKNTVILTAGASRLHCLLRWKNTLGICCPAWQISLHR
jgi:hypothetical protein